MPLADIRKIDIVKWSHELIKKHELTHKAYSNMAIILRQILDYLVDMEVIEANPYYAVPLFFRSGLRIEECLALSFDDFQEGTIRRLSVPCKNPIQLGKQDTPPL